MPKSPGMRNISPRLIGEKLSRGSLTTGSPARYNKGTPTEGDKMIVIAFFAKDGSRSGEMVVADLEDATHVIERHLIKGGTVTIGMGH